jgi:hypothetical protein
MSQLLGFFILSIVRYSKKNLENTTFRKLDLSLSSGEGEDTYSLGPLRKSEPQSMDNPVQYNYSYINT